MTPISSLKPHPRNYRIHPDDQLEHIIKSIKDHGFYRNVVAAKDWTILAGHGVVAAARKMGIKNVPVIQLDLDPLAPKALKLLAGDNEIGHLGEIDDRALTEMLKELKLSDEGLLGTGFDEKMLANLIFVTRPESEIKSLNEAAEWVGMPSYDDSGDALCLIVRFKSEAIREKFVNKYKLRIDLKRGRAWSMFWPKPEKQKPSDFKFEPQK